MFASRRDTRNSSTSGILLKAKRFGIFSVFAITANIFTIPLAAYSQIAVDGSTATEVKGNVISPTGAGTVNGGNLYNSFQEFNVPTSGVIFNTGNSSVDGSKINNLINRVTGENPSSILGTIESRQAYPNANLYLLNPNGVIFSPNARLDIGGSFNVSTGTGLGFNQNQKFTVDKNSLSFPSGDPKNIQFAIAQPAGIINQGNLSVDAGKNIAITAGTVINTGNLTAPNGNVSLAAVSGNSQVELRSPDLVLGLSVSKDAIPSNWNGAIASLPKLAESLTGKAAEANQVVVKPDGSIALVTNPSSSDIVVKDGMAIASGIINVSSESSKGGNVGIFGNQVGLVNAQINASGATGGGTVLIGGDFQGKGVAPNALQTYIDTSSKILANGLLTGDGGKVIVWADRSTQFLGAIAARGAEISGNGGFVEVSGKENLSYQGDTDTRATNGTTGTLLLDPTNIVVVGSGINSLAEVSTFSNNPAIGLATISSSLINGANSNVILQATDTITFGNAISITNSGISLTAQAGNSIFVGSPITTNGGNVNLIGNDPSNPTGLGNITINSPITTNGGAINIQINNAAGLLVNSSLISGGGNITLGANSTVAGASGVNIGGFGSIINSGNGNILINGSSTTAKGISISGFNSSITSNSGSITLNGSTNSGNSVTGSGLTIGGGSSITSNSGTINISGFSNGVTGSDGVVVESVFSGNSTTISNASGNINIVGNAVNPLRQGINIKAPFLGGVLALNSGSGDFNFTSDRSEFPSIGLQGTGTISLNAFTPNVALTIGGNNVFLSNSFLTSLALSSGFSNVVIGDIAGNNAITVAQNSSINTSNFAPITIQTARTLNGNGFTIGANSSQFNLTANQGINSLGNITNNNGGIALFANQNITTGNITANGKAISITSTLGEIDTSAGSLASSPSLGVGNGGAIALAALGNITTGNIFSSTSNGSGGAISIVSTGANGAIATNGVLDSFSTTNGTGGNVLLQAAGNITTNNLLISAASNGNAGNISYISSGGSIIANQRVRSASAGTTLANGKGGDILFQAAGNITTSEIISQATGFGSGGNITVISNGGNITTNGNVTSSAFNSSSGNGGNVLFQANGNILVTGNINPSANVSPAAGTEGQISITSDAGSLNLQNLGNGSLVKLLAQQNITTGNITTLGDGNISITSNAGSINTSGNIFSSGDGNSGTITLLALGNITTAKVESFSSFNRPGSISLTSTNGSILLGGDILTRSLFGGDTDVNNVGNITLAGNVSLLTPVTLITQDDGIGGNINLANANITGNQSLLLDAGSGTVTLGAIGTNVIPLASLDILSGNTILNGDIFTVSDLTFSSPVTLANNVAIATSGSPINFNSTINGNQLLSLNAANNSIFFNGIVGGITPLAGLTINPVSLLDSLTSIDIKASGNISTGEIGSVFSPVNVAIQTTGSFNPNGSSIDSTSLNLSANQGVNALGNVFSNGGNINIVSSLGSINSDLDTELRTSIFTSSSADSGNISVTAANGSLNLQNLITISSGEIPSKAGNITLTVAGNNNISVKDIFASTFGNTTGSAGTVVFSMGTGNINLIGNVIDLTSQNGSATNLVFNNPVVVNSPTIVVDGVTISGLTIDTIGSTGSGNVVFNNTVTSPNASNVTINSGVGNVTFNNAIASSGQPLGNFTVNSLGTTTFASTVFANSISSPLGNTIINADIVATGTNGFISLKDFTANGNISLVGNEINFTGIAAGNGNLTLKPLTTTQLIAIGGTVDTGTSTLNLLNSDLSAFVNGTFNSLTIGNLNGSGAISLSGNVSFFQPTTIQSPVGNGSFFGSGFNVTGVGGLGIEVGNSIAINNSTFAPSAGNSLNVRLNADRDTSGSGTITLFNSSISTGGQNITLGGGLNPVIDPAIAIGNTAGVTINSSTLNAQGGNIFVNGLNTSTFGNSNNGILVARANTTQPISSLLTSGLGTITLVGTGATVGLNNSDGISIESGSVIESVNGNISLVGVGGNGTSFNDGIEIEGNSLLRTIGIGNISLVGDTLSTGIDNRDVNIVGSIIETLGTGAISIASSPSTPRLIQVVNSSINPTTVGGSGTVTLESEAIELLGSTQIKGVGQLIIQPTFSSTGIRLGGSINDANLNLSSAELATIQDGFSQIFIGRTDTSGLITLASDVIFNDPVTLRSQGVGGSINTSGFDFTSTGAISFLANQNITTSNITALGNNLTLNSSLGAINTSQGLLNTSSTTGNGGNISLLSPSINTNLGSINTSSTVGNAGNLSFANISNGLITIAGSDINLSSGSGVAGSLNFLAPVVISNPNLTINTSSSLGTSGAVTFSNNLNGAIVNSNSLTVNAGSGNVTFNAIGNSIALGNLTVNTSGFTNFNNAVRANSLSTSVGGTTTINGDISTNGSQIYNDSVSLAANAILSTLNNDITFNGTVNGNQELTLNAGAGNITFGSTVGNTSTLGNIIANSSAFTNFNGVVNATTVTTDLDGATNVNANITTVATQTYSDNVNLNNATIFTANNATISFNGNINGNQALRVLSGTGDINFRGTVNADNLIAESIGITRFNTVNAVSVFTDELGTTELNGNITTTGTVIFNDVVNLLSAIQFNTGAITFNNNVSGNQNLTLNSGANNITFGGTTTVNNLIANSTGITQFNTVNAGTLITNVGGITELNGNITTTGTVTFNDAVNLLSAIQFNTGGAIAFNNTVSGNQNLTLNSGANNITFGNTVTVNNLIANSTGTTRFNAINAASLLTNAGGTTELNGNVTTTGAVTFNDAVNLLSTIQFNTGGAIAFNNGLNGNQDLTLNNGANNITFGGTTTVNNLIANSTGTTRFNTVNATSLLTNAGGTTELNGNITTTGAVTFNDAVNLLNTIQFNTGGAIAFNNGLNGNQDLTLNNGANNITFGGTTTVNNLIANSTGTTRFNTVNATSLLTNAGGTTELNGNITTTGAVTFNDAVNLLNTIQFNTGGAIAFNNGLNGNQDLTLNNGANNITFGGTTTVNNLIANSTGTTRFNTVNATSLLTNAGGTTELNGNITTTGAVTFNDAVDLLSAIQFNTGGAIAFNNGLNGNQDLTLNNGANDITFGGTATVNNLIANSTGITRFNTVNAESLLTNAGGTTELNGNVTTTGAVTFNDAVNLLSAIQFNTGGAIAFNNNVSGNQNLTINSGTNSITFGGTTIVNNLTANSTGTTRFNAVNAASLLTNAGGTTELNGNITTTGAVTFNDAVNLLNTIQFNTGSAIAFNNGLNGNQDLTLNNGANNITFGGTTTVNNLIANSTGTTRFNTVNATSLLTNAGGTTELNGNITTTGAVTFNDAVDLLNAIQFNTGGAIAFNNTVSGNQDVTLNSSANNITFGSPTTVNNLIANSTGITRFNTVNAASLLTNAGGTTELNGNVTTTEAVTFNDAVNLLSAIQFNTGGAIAFNNGLNGNQNLTINNGANNITFGGTTTVNNLIANSTGITQFNTVNTGTLITNAGGITEVNGNITTTGAVTFNDAVNLLSAIQFNTGGTIAFNNGLNGNQNLTINNGANNITFGGTTTVNNLIANSTGTTRFNTVNAASLLTNAGGTTELNGNINATGAVTFNDAVNLLSAIQFNTGGAIAFNNGVNGAFALTIDTNGNSVVAKNGIGTINPLQSLTIAANTTLTSTPNSSSGASNLDVITVGDVSLGNVINNGANVNIQSKSGAIAVGNVDSSASSSTGNAGNINLSAEKDVRAGNINSSSFSNGGAVNIESRTAKISTGDVNTSGFSGGDVFFNASTEINAGVINTTGNGGNGGNVTLDPSGDVVVAAINTSGLRGGNVTLVSTGANLRITDVLTSASASCIGASICTSGSSSFGTISLQTGGINSFLVGDASINGSKGFLTTGISTLSLGTAIPVLLDNTFNQGGISITPGGFVPIIDPNNNFEPPQRPEILITGGQNTPQILSVRDVLIGEADRYLQEGNLAKAFDVIEQAYVSQLGVFTGKSVDTEPITIENTQDMLSTVVQQTGDVAALIYPVLLKNRIEILVVPPKEKGKPFSAFTIAANQDTIETLVDEYRNNLRDVGSNDYLEQSQKLYDWVIRPIEKRLEEMKIDTLVFVMDGGLRVTPPAALHDGKQFLIERYAIANIPSLRVTRIEERDRKTTRVLAMGLTESVEGFSALPSVDIEIKTISSEVLKGAAFLNQDFTVNNLQKQRQGGAFNILHLGTHAKFVSDTSKDSFIQFWDSRLKLSEIPQLRFDSPAIDMLALSACQTAVGNNLGISGLAVESGAKSVLASLWEVSDAGTAPLMISFYKAFPDAVNKAQAMRTAQLALLGGKVKIGNGQILGIEGFPNIPLPSGLSDIDLSHPFYWSSFILVGNWL